MSSPAGGFSGAAARQRFSPFARSALGRVADVLGRRAPGAHGPPVAHLGAGTGIVTGQLARTGAVLVALEVDHDARLQLRRSAPQVAVLAGAGGALPLRRGALGGALLTDERPLALPAVRDELRRVLAPGGLVVLLIDAAPGRSVDPVRLDGSVPTASVHPHVRPDGSERESHVLVWHAG